MNPFSENTMQHGQYSKQVREFICGLSIGQSSVIDLMGKNIQSFRMTAGKIAQEIGIVITTKRSEEGSYWIKRIA